MIIKINEKRRLIKLLKTLADIDDIEIIKYTLESIVDELSQNITPKKDSKNIKV